MAAGCVEVDTNCIHTRLHNHIERLLQLRLVHIMLILTYADALRVNLHKLSKWVHKASSDRNRSTHRHILLRKLLTRNLRSRVNRSTVLAHHEDMYLRVKTYLL